MAVSISISITQNSQSIANNTSNVTVKVNASWTGGSYNLTQKSGWLKIDGTTYDFTSSFNTGRTTSGSQALFTKTIDISHAANGTKTLACSASYTSGVSSGTVTASASKTLTTIPRKSTFSVSNGTLGAAQTITVTRQASTFTHTITYSCGSASGTICTKSSDTSVSWTPPLSLASQNTTGLSVSVTLIVTTYSGSTDVGSNTKTISCAIPASVAPSCTLTVTDPTGHFNTYGYFVKGLSKFKVAVSATTAYGSAISSYRTTANGTTYTAAAFTTGALTASGSLKVSSTVTDKRGRKGSASTTLKVLNYSVPAIAKLTVLRCNEDGTANDQGEYVQVTYSANVTSLDDQNSASYMLRYKRASDDTYTEVGLDTHNNVYAVTDGTYIFQADSSSSYSIEFSVTDNHNTTTRSTTASTAFTLLHWNASGTGIGIGKLAEEEDLFDIGLPARFNQPVCGNVLGLNKLPKIQANSDFNDYLDTGCWAVYTNADAATIANIPVSTAGRLEVSSPTGEGVRVTQWSYLRQRYIPYKKDNAVWERDIMRNSENVWTYGDWWRSSLTPAVSENVYHEQKCLWGADLAGGMYMTETHVANLTEAVSAQPHGIVLVFCAYNSADDTNFAWQTFFVPKQLVALTSYGHNFMLGRGNFTYVGMKYLYIKDTSISGHADNDATGTVNGITYANNKFVLRYVIGV